MSQNAEIIQSDAKERFARGWYCLGQETDFSKEPQKFNYFGSSFVVYRGESGEIHILDAYCPHMGANLAKGFVDGDSLRCPFHAWSWGSDGVCDHIPYAKTIPKKAVTKSWPTMIENGLLFVWYDYEGNPPIEAQRVPKIDDYYSGEWTDWIFEKMTINTHPRELIDNMADSGHFFVVHESPPTSFKNIVEGHTYTQEMASGSVVLPDLSMTSTATYNGPSIMNTYMETWYEGIGVGEPVVKRLLVTHIPVDHNSFDLRFGMLIKKKAEWNDEDEANELKFAAQITQMGFFQDVKIWEDKIKIDNPILCDGDGPVNKLRQWHQQFYTDIDKVPTHFNERKEYVVNCPSEPDPKISKHILENSEIAQWIADNDLDGVEL